MYEKRGALPRAVILTAIQAEYKAVRAHLTDLHEEPHPQGTVYERGIFSGISQHWDVIIGEIGVGNPTAALEAERAISYFQPSIILFVGIAGGRKDVKLGDVIAATKIYGYESGKAEAIFLPRPEIGRTTYRLEQRARAEARKSDWLQRIKGSLPIPTPTVYVAPIAAGQKVVASTRSQVAEFLTENYGDALAIEMEGYGFLEAVHANAQVEALVVRGISDLLDGKHEVDAGGSQEQAARHASAFAFAILASLEGTSTARQGSSSFDSSRTPSPLLAQPSPSPFIPLLRFPRLFHIRTAIFYFNRPIFIILILFLLTSTGVLTFYFSSVSKLETTTIFHSTACNANTYVPTLVTASTRTYASYVASNGIMFGFDSQRTHSNPYEGFLTPSTVGHLICYWKTSTMGPIVYSSPVVANGVVYIGSQDSKLYAFKLDKCRSTNCPVLWIGKTGGLIDSSPAVVNNVVYVGSHDDYLYAFKADGCGQRICDPLWQAQTKGTIGSSPVVLNNTVYIGSDDHYLYAFKADGCGYSTCSPLWTAQTEGCVCSSPTVANHLVYVSSDRLYVFKANGCGTPTCKPLWTAKLAQGTASSVAILNGIAYVGANDGKLYAFKTNGCGHSTCFPLWTAQTGDAISSSPAVVDNVVFVGSYDHYLYAFKTDGCNHPTCPPLWTAQTGDKIYSSPTVANNVVYIGSDDDYLYAFKANGCGHSTCSPQWAYLTSGPIRSSPAVANGVVYVGSADNSLYAFSLPNT